MKYVGGASAKFSKPLIVNTLSDGGFLRGQWVVERVKNRIFFRKNNIIRQLARKIFDFYF
jgi:hypothetical protein